MLPINRKNNLLLSKFLPFAFSFYIDMGGVYNKLIHEIRCVIYFDR